MVGQRVLVPPVGVRALLPEPFFCLYGAVSATQMNRILPYFESPDDVETEGIEPMHALQPASALRYNEARPCMPLNAVFANAFDSEKIFSQFQKS